MTDIGKRIKELRNERDLTIEMVVADMNRKFNFDPPYHKSMISRWENQKSEPTLENAKYLSLYFDVSLDYLIGITNIRTPLRLRRR